MPKTINLHDAQDKLTAATAAVDQLKAKLLNEGPGSVTAEELGHAALDVEHAKLALAHAAKQAEDQAAAERLEQLELLKAQILDQASSADQALDCMQRLEEAAAELISACAGRQQLIAQATAAMRRAAVPQGNDIDGAHAGLGWTQASMGMGDAIHVNGRRIADVSPGVLVAAALARAAQQAGVGVGYLRPAVDVPGVHQALTQDPAGWLQTSY